MRRSWHRQTVGGASLFNLFDQGSFDVNQEEIVLRRMSGYL